MFLDTIKLRQDLLSELPGLGHSSPYCRSGPLPPEVGPRAPDPAYNYVSGSNALLVTRGMQTEAG